MKENGFVKRMTAIMGSFAVLASVSFVAIDSNSSGDDGITSGIDRIEAEASGSGQVSESGGNAGGGGGVGGSGHHAWGVFRSGDHGGMSAYDQIRGSHSWGSSLYTQYAGSSYAWDGHPGAGRNVSQDLANASARGPVNCLNADVILNYATRNGPADSVTHGNNALRGEVRKPHESGTSTSRLDSDEWDLIQTAISGSSYVLCANWGPAAVMEMRQPASWNPELEVRTDSVGSEREFEEVISRQAEITPGVNFSGNIGDQRLHAQTTVDLTPFGVMREAVRCEGSPSDILSLIDNNSANGFINECGLSSNQISSSLYNDIRSDVRSAGGSTSDAVDARNALISVVEGAARRTGANSPGSDDPYTEQGNGSAPWVKLTERNQQAFAEGGVLDVMQREQTGQITIPRVEETQVRERERRNAWLVYDDGTEELSHHEIRNPSTGEWEERSRSSNFGWSDWSSTYSIGNVETSQESYKSSDFFQMLSVTCNVEDFETVLSQVDGATSKEHIRNSSGNHYRNDPKFSGVAYSQTQNLRYNSSLSRDFGTGSGNLSDDIEFYTKECNFQTAAQGGDDDPTHRVNGDNQGSFEDAVDSNPTSGEPFGEGASDLNELLFVSDNEPNRIELRASQPSASQSISVRGFANDGIPTRTLVTRWSDGTPGVDQEDGTFTMRAIDDSGDGSDSGRLFDGNDDITLRHDQGSPSPASSPTVEVVDGAYNKFDVGGNWASTSDRPEVISVAWGYEANLQTTFNQWVRPGGGDRYRTSGIGTPTVTSGNYGRSHVEFNADDFALVDHLDETTGAGVDYESIQDHLGTSADGSNNLIVRFTDQVAGR